MLMRIARGQRLLAYVVGMPFTPRSAATRDAILAAARDLLTTRGYEGTTIRAVAAAAKVDPSMVMRYYGSKAGLFGAAVDLDLKLPDVAHTARGRLGQVMARHFVTRWEGDLADESVMLLLRSASTHQFAAEQFHSIFNDQVLRLVREVIGDAPDTEVRAAMVSTQLLGLALCRYVIKLPQVVALNGDELAAMIAPVLQPDLTQSRRQDPRRRKARSPARRFG